MQILDGKVTSSKILEALRTKNEALMGTGQRPPHLVAILVGNDGASETYVASKVKHCEQVGFKSTLFRYEDSVTQEKLLELIDTLNADKAVDGILLQLPLPKHIDEFRVTDAIAPGKDVDGFHPENLGRMLKGLPSYLPATPYGILLILESYGIDTAGKHCVIVGRSNIVGKPMSVLMSRNAYPGNCTVTLCHSQTPDLAEHCRRADILIAALGKPEFIRAGMVKDGAVVIDVGITRVKDDRKKSGYSIRGDVAFAEVSAKCAYISPVPGGVGLMTIAGLLMNTWKAREMNNK